MSHRRNRALYGALLMAAALPAFLVSQTAQTNQPSRPVARSAIMRAVDGHSVEWEAGYIRHLEWHRQAKDPSAWYSYTVWASTERQRWIIYATFGHTAAELSNPVSPAEDEKDNLINVLPHAQFLGNAVYEFLPVLSRGNGIPTPLLRAEYTTVELKFGAEKEFEAALAAEQSKLRGETLWFRMVAGGDTPRYVRLRPRPTLGAIIEEAGEQALPEKTNSLISRMTVETLNLRPNMLVNVTPGASALSGEVMAPNPEGYRPTPLLRR